VSDLPPHSPEAERAVIGFVLADGTLMPQAREKLKPGPAVFYDLRHQKLWAHILALDEAGRAVNTMELYGRLSVADGLSGCGGDEYISTLEDQTAGATFDGAVEILITRYLTRQALQCVSDARAQLADTPDADPARIMAACDERFRDVHALGVVEEQRSFAAVVWGIGERLDKYRRGVGLLSGIQTKFGYFDKLTGGLAEGYVYVIAARPSTGKTSLGINLAEQIACDQNIPVAFFSLEMSADDIVLRLMCSRARSNFHRVRTGFMDGADYEALARITPGIVKSPLYVDETPGLDIAVLRAKARRLWAQHGIKLIIVDYLQLMSSETQRGQGREREVAQISNGLKRLAKELKVPVIALAQLNREIEKDKHRPPQLSDIRESGAIEQDADVVGLMYVEPEVREVKLKDGSIKKVPLGPDEMKELTEWKVDIIIAKNRNGPTGHCRFRFHREQMRFEDFYGNRGSDEGLPQTYADGSSSEPSRDEGRGSSELSPTDLAAVAQNFPGMEASD
jgi:replicative DNA helicase